MCFDGIGYPRGLQGEAIPFGTRLFAVIDTLDAMTSNRPTAGDCHSTDTVKTEILRMSDRQFDLEAVPGWPQTNRSGGTWSRSSAGTLLWPEFRGQQAGHVPNVYRAFREVYKQVIHTSSMGQLLRRTLAMSANDSGATTPRTDSQTITGDHHEIQDRSCHQRILCTHRAFLRSECRAGITSCRADHQHGATDTGNYHTKDTAPQSHDRETRRTYRVRRLGRQNRSEGKNTAPATQSPARHEVTR